MGSSLSRRELIGRGLTFGAVLAVAGMPSMARHSDKFASWSASPEYPTLKTGDGLSAKNRYRIYSPTVTTSLVINTYDEPSGLKFVGDMSVAHYGGQFWAVTDGGTGGYLEGAAGTQRIWMTTSTDGATWTAPFTPFRDPTYCHNPLDGAATEWQPNFVVVGDELWVLWSGADGYLSKLASPTGKWTNYRFEFINERVFISTVIAGSATPGRSVSPTVDGISDWLPYPSADPIILDSGVIACPATIYSRGHYTTQIANSGGFARALKYNVLLKTRNGTDWSMTRIRNGDFGNYVAWEPFVVEAPAGYVSVFSRHLDYSAPAEDTMLVAYSSDGGETFAPPVSSTMLVPETRGFARRVSQSRWFMTHCDFPSNGGHYDRQNGALFVSRRGSDDFVPGVSFSESDFTVKYPQFIIVDDSVYICYASGSPGGARGQGRYCYRMTIVTPIPGDDQACIHPRSLSLHAGVADPELIDGAIPYYRFNGHTAIVSSASVKPSAGLTFTAWMNNTYEPPVYAAVVDIRSGLSGSVFRMNGISFCAMDVLHSYDIPLETDLFMAAVLHDNATTVTFYLAYGQTDFISKTSYFRSILFVGQPSEAETVTIDGTVYTFKTAPAVMNDVLIGSTAMDTVTNLKAAVNAALGTGNSSSNFVLDTRLVVTRPDGAAFTVSTDSANITIETSVFHGGGSAYFGGSAPGSSVPSYRGMLYDAAIYDGALSAANLRSLYNARSAEFGYDAISGSSAAPRNLLLRVDPANPDHVTFPPLGGAARCEIISDTLLRIHGEGSASVELPYAATKVSITYKLGEAPSGAEKYVIATFGRSDSPVRLFVAGDGPNDLYLNGTRVCTLDDPTGWETADVVVSTNKVTVNNIECDFSGDARCFLGNAYPESRLAADKHIDFDIAWMEPIQAQLLGPADG